MIGNKISKYRICWKVMWDIFLLFSLSNIFSWFLSFNFKMSGLTSEKSLIVYPGITHVFPSYRLSNSVLCPKKNLVKYLPTLLIWGRSYYLVTVFIYIFSKRSSTSFDFFYSLAFHEDSFIHLPSRLKVIKR